MAEKATKPRRRKATPKKDTTTDAPPDTTTDAPPDNTTDIDAPVVPVPASGELEIVRADRNRWWCPACDHANTTKSEECGGCHRVRAGDVVS